MSTKNNRLFFWMILLSLVVGGGYYYWQQLPPQQVKLQLSRLEHSNAKIASNAWKKLSHLYFTDWAAFYLIFDEMRNNKPISFLIEKSAPTIVQGEERELFEANNRAIFYKSDQIYCETIGEALLAIAHNAPNLDSQYSGDWEQWWKENQKAIQSGR